VIEGKNHNAAGSMNMSYDSSNLTTPDIKWLGVRPSDLDRFNIPQQCRLPMTDEDIRTGRKLVGGALFISRPRVPHCPPSGFLRVLAACKPPPL